MFLGRVIGEVWATKKCADLEGKRLLVVERISADQLGRGIGNVDRHKVFAWQDAIDLDQAKLVNGTPRELDHPLHAFRLGLDDAPRQCRTKTERVEHITQVLRKLDVQDLSRILDVCAGKFELGRTVTVAVEEYLLDQCSVAVGRFSHKQPSPR